MNLPERKSFCSGLIILSKMGLTLFVTHKEISLYVVFKSEIGLQFLRRLRAFPNLGRQVMRPSVWESDSFPFLKLSLILFRN